MTYALISIVSILLTIFFVIGTHEFAHFIAARALGVKVLCFSIGFGKKLFRWHDKKGTEYIIALVPLGGFVKMLDENEGSVSPQELPYAFNRQPFYKKFLIVFAGPVMNIACALLLYWLIFMLGFVSIKPIIGKINPHSIAAASGLQSNQQILRIDDHHVNSWTGVTLRILAHAGNQDTLKLEVQDMATKKISTHALNLATWRMEGLTPDPFSSLGMNPYQIEFPLVIGAINPKSPASQSSLRINDKVLAVNHIPIKNWDELMLTIINHPNDTLTFSIERQGKVLHLPVILGSKHNIYWQKFGYLGIGPTFVWPPEFLLKIQYPPQAALAHAWNQIVDFTYFNLLLLTKMVTGKLSLQTLGGPITIFETAGEALNYGFLSFIGFLAFLSISIGVINLLPIPGLDGGHLFFQVIESIIRRPIPERVLLLFYRLGFIIIFVAVIQALINDLMRLLLKT